jgi:transcriptional regulator with XRE-family HTH domain
MAPNIALPITDVKGNNRPSDIGIANTCPMVRDMGMRLRHARKLRGLTQVELAKASGVKQATISELETGESRSPWGTNLVALAQSLKVSSDWLASGKGSMDAQATPLPPEADKVARNWMRLAPEVRKSVATMIQEMVKTSSAEKDPTPDERVEQAYGKPGAKSVKKT